MKKTATTTATHTVPTKANRNTKPSPGRRCVLRKIKDGDHIEKSMKIEQPFEASSRTPPKQQFLKHTHPSSATSQPE